MATEVKLPDLGEGVEEASISRWLVKEGDTVQVGDALLEIATDKVDTEVPSPVAGKILKIVLGENAIAAAGDVLATVGEEGEESAPPKDEKPAAEKPAEEKPKAKQEAPAAEKKTEKSAEKAAPASEDKPAADATDGAQDLKATPVAKRVAAERGISLSGITGTGPGGQITKDDVLAQADGGTETDEGLPGDLANVANLSVRRLAADYSVELAEVAGDRPLSTLTRYDVLNFVASRGNTTVTVGERYLPPKNWTQSSSTAPTKAAEAESKSDAAPAKAASPAKEAAPAPAKASSGSELIKPSRMRQIIAKNTFESLQSSPQLTTWHDVDMTAVINHRKAHKNEFAAAGVNLTVTAYLIAATVAGLKAVPAANTTWTDDGILLHHDYHIGMAAALPADKNGFGGLIVPVIKNAGDLSLQGIARQVNALAEKARSNKVTSEDMQGGTFTLTNYGTSGSVFQTPIIHQGQAGILGTGTIEKRAVVVSNGSPLEANLGDYLSFKPMMTLAFTFDHRVLDGATADAFCVAVKKALEGWS